MRARAWLLIALALSLAGIAACSPRRATIEVDRPVALADAPVHIRIRGLDPGEAVTISAQARDAGGKVWRSQAQFTADGGGVVDLDRAQPGSGTYQGVDGMGLFWSMNPPDGDPDQAIYSDPCEGIFIPAEGPSFTVDLTVAADGRDLATRGLTRQWHGDGVTARTLRMDTDQVAGVLMLPPAGTPPRVAVLVIGGSGGGVMASEAALLAAHGHPARAEGGLPAGGAAWTRAGRPIAAGSPIPVERLDGPILLLAGTDDAVWSSALFVQELTDRLDAHRFGHPHQALVYPQAGHGVGTFPFQPAGTTLIHPVTGSLLSLGGTRPADAAARRDGWPKVLDFLARL